MVVREEGYLAAFIFIIHAHLPEKSMKYASKIFILPFELQKIFSNQS